MTVIIVPTSAPTTTEHAFTAETVSGWVLNISVTTPVGVQSSEVVRDMRETGLINVHPASGGIGWHVVPISVIIWMFLFVAGLLVMALLDVSGLYSNSRPFWVDSIPVLGGTSFWTGMLRLWIVLAIPFVVFVSAFTLRREKSS